MDEINKIKKARFFQGKNTNEIAIKFNRSWATVDKYIKTPSEELKAKKKQARKKTVIIERVVKKITEYIDDEIKRNVSKEQRYRSPLKEKVRNCFAYSCLKAKNSLRFWQEWHFG